MRKIKDSALFQSIRKFLTEDMPIVRKKSANTVEAYRYTLNLFFAFLRENITNYSGRSLQKIFAKVMSWSLWIGLWKCAETRLRQSICV